jgi:hypothetical protein
MHSLMSSDGLFAMSTSAVDLIGTCACAQEVQFKRILASDLGFGNLSLPSSLRDASLLQSMGTSQAGQNKFTIFSRMFISDRDGIINLHQVPTSQHCWEADIDDIDLWFCLGFSSVSWDVLINAVLPSLACRELAYKLSLYSTCLNSATLSTSVSLVSVRVSMTVWCGTWEWWC